MTNENEIIEYERNKPPQLKRVELQRARKIAIVLASATVVSLLFMVFAFIQKTRAESLQEEVTRIRAELERCQSN